MAKTAPTFRSADGLEWRVDVRNPSASHALVVFTHPDPRRTRENRYAHFIWTGPESQNVSTRTEPASVMERLDTAALTRLFRRSMAMAGRPAILGRVV